ncbi:MAG: hypothetical protein DKT66_23580 [Candidatus Melainabacteria bacterium]|nr:MAG: hypothetical protein DKT66_23580 [Candidatus Melainabacteria bacterium]
MSLMLTGAIDLICQYIVPQYRLILVKEPGIKPTHISDPISFHHFVQPLAHYSEEHFIAFHLDAKHQVIGYHEVSKGRSNSIFKISKAAAWRLFAYHSTRALLVQRGKPRGYPPSALFL